MVSSKESDTSALQLLHHTNSTSKSKQAFVSLCREVVLEELDLPAIMENKAVKIVQRAITAVL